jgi:hypothetical protein
MDFKVYYDDPLNDRLLIFEDETIPDAAAKNTEEVLQKDGTTREMLDPTKISAAKLQTEVRFRHLRACKPQKWGDSSTLITKSADEEKLDALTIDELEEKISKFIYKDQVLKAK